MGCPIGSAEVAFRINGRFPTLDVPKRKKDAVTVVRKPNVVLDLAVLKKNY